ncbi:SLIT-ROBO Rho GTPase-activating protein 3 isoform X2 [Anguilla anguilla]|uniref:SLIT-ROBO Rho GTPase-activating protein 3 isoform X2 n=1 Tax=Anguilla anguilla TaxID=7936 RepID=UPI0015A9DFE8|nr:SLIT-ROBO Rho GTPase-activating protein 3 isoform X2 [Anguilla anguilla]
MTSHGKLKREKGSLAEYETQIKEVRNQLSEQLKVLDAQLEQKTQQLQDMSDYLRRRGEIEGEYARALDKLTERFTKVKRKEQSELSVAQCWSVLLAQTRQDSRDHGAMSEYCSNNLTQRLSHCTEDTYRLAKRSKEVGLQIQDELLKVTSELQLALKTYHQYHTDYLSAEGKLKEAMRLEERKTGKATDLGVISQSGGQRRSSVKKMDRLMEKRLGKVQEMQLKCTKARNDYLLSLAAANASMNKYYLQDICTIIDCTDLGYHLSLSRVMHGFLSSRHRIQENLKNGLQQLEGAITGLDQNQDRDALLQAHNATFCLPFRFQYQPHEGDEVCEVSAECQVRYELDTRFQQLQSRLAAITLETEEVSKTLRATHAALLENISDDDCNLPPDNTVGQPQEGDAPSSKLSMLKRRANQQETEGYYFTKVKEQLSGSSLMSKLQAKHDLLKEAIHKAEAIDSDPSRTHSSRSVRVRKSRPCSQYHHKLFTGDMLSFIQSSGQPIPLVVENCIRFINLHGLHHEGIFRVPGSQSVVAHIRDAFERGEDPLTDSDCDIDSVAGVLKLYFRGLEKPLFPEESFSQLMECVQIESETERATHIKSVISSFPQPIVIVMRYLFAFLHHVSQYSDENMMQPYNLAVCFGPSLLRGAETGDAVTLQPQINALVKTMILQHEVIFPGPLELQGPVYEKCMTLEQEYCEPITEEGEGESEHPHSEDNCDAVAMFDYVARSTAELSFKQGDHLLLHCKASPDWWKGEVGGVKGLIPHKYISVSDGGGHQPERGRREDSRGGSTGNLSEEKQLAEQGTRLRVNSDSASLPSRQKGGGSCSPVRKLPQHLPEGRLILPHSPGLGRQHAGLQERRNTLESVRQMGQPDRQTVQVDKEVSRQMNSVFKELLARQPPPDTATPAPAVASSPPPSAPRSSQKKGGFGLRGRDLFKPAKPQD